MKGCAAVGCAVLAPAETENSRPHRIQFHHVALLTAKISDACKQHVDFSAAVLKQRVAMQDAFRQMQAVLDRVQHDALRDFDEKVSAAEKRWDAEIVSLEVHANQAVVGAAYEHNVSMTNTDNSVALMDVPEFSHVSVEALKRVLAACCSVILPSARPDLPWENNSLRTAHAELLRLMAVSEQVNAALEIAKVNENDKRAAALQQHSPLKCSSTFHFDFQVSGLAVKDDASLFAVTNYFGSCVMVCKLPSGEMLTKFGSQGDAPGQFHGPSRLCFTPFGTLLVSDTGNNCVQEVKTNGDHLRTLIRGYQVVHVTCNADVIVISCSNKTEVICVFDIHTGAFLRHFVNVNSPSGRVHLVSDTTFSFDGKTLLLADVGDKRVSVLALDGSFLGSIKYDESFCENIFSVTELRDGRIGTIHKLFQNDARLVVVLPEKHARKAALSAADCLPTLLPERFNGVDWTLQIRCCAKGVMVSAGSMVHIFT